MATRPTLLNSCARAATTEEARFRISGSLGSPRAARVIALDAPAATTVALVAARGWKGARFFVLPPEALAPTMGNGHKSVGDGLVLRAIDDGNEHLEVALAGADVALLVATNDSGVAAAAAIGRECGRRRISTAGLIFGDPELVGPAVQALRPHAGVLMVSRDAEDVAEILTALRA